MCSHAEQRGPQSGLDLPPPQRPRASMPRSCGRTLPYPPPQLSSAPATARLMIASTVRRGSCEGPSSPAARPQRRREAVAPQRLDPYPPAQRLSARRTGTTALSPPPRHRRRGPPQLVELMRGPCETARHEREGEEGTERRVGASNCTRTPVTSAHQSHSCAAPPPAA